MTITKQIENLKAKLSTVRSNSEYNKREKKRMKLAKQYNNQNSKERYFIYDNTVYGLESNPNYYNDDYYFNNNNNWDNDIK